MIARIGGLQDSELPKMIIADGDNNNLVFGDDMGKQAEEMRKHRNVVMKGEQSTLQDGNA